MNQKVIIRLSILFLVAAFAHNIFHEFGHWLVGTLLGNQMSMTLNGTWPTSGEYPQEWHSPAVGIGGPAFSILMASVALIVIEKYRILYAYPFLYFPLFARAFALKFGDFSSQDEARVSKALELGKYTVAIAVCVILLALVWRGSFKLKLGFAAIMACFLISTVGELAVIAVHKYFF